MSTSSIFFEARSGHVGDVIPYYENGEYKLFFLDNGWHCVTTRDQLHFADEYETGLHGGTGSVLKANGCYHIFYCKFACVPEPRQYVCHATSTDLRTWQEHPEHTFLPDDDIYEMSDWRDPHVVWNDAEQCWWMLLAAQQKGKTKRKGCVGLCSSRDLIHWTYRPPLYAPQTNQSAHECPDLFHWGDWWYLTYSVYTDRFQTLYRMSKSPSGPWITPDVDTFDTRCFYAAKHGTDGCEHFMYGWNPRREKNIWQFNPQMDFGQDYNTWDWGGSMVIHKLLQQVDGTLAVTVPQAVDQAFGQAEAIRLQPLNGRWYVNENAAEAASPYGYASLLMNAVPVCGKLEMDVRFTQTPREFGIALQVDEDFAEGYYLIFEPNRGRVQYKTGLRMYEDGGKMFPYDVEQERPFAWEPNRVYHLRILVQGSILLLYLDDRIALGTRMFNHTGRRFGLFVSDGSACFDNICLILR